MTTALDLVPSPAVPLVRPGRAARPGTALLLVPPVTPGRSRSHAPSLRPARTTSPLRGPARPEPPPAVPELPDHPDARPAVTRVLRIACEVFDGRRPDAHLAAHADPAVLRYWRAATDVRHRRPPARFFPARFARVQIGHPCSGAAEVATALDVDGRVRALAARFDLVGGRWRWSAVRLG